MLIVLAPCAGGCEVVWPPPFLASCFKQETTTAQVLSFCTPHKKNIGTIKRIMHASHTREETRRLMFTRSLFLFSVKTLHDVFTLPCYRNDERCTEGDERDCTRTRKNIPMDGKFIFNFSFSDLYSALFTKELLWVSAGYKCLMYLDPLSGSILQQEQGNKVDKYKTSKGAALCTPLC